MTKQQYPGLSVFEEASLRTNAPLGMLAKNDTKKSENRYVRLCLHINTRACGNAGKKTLWVVNRGGGRPRVRGREKKERKNYR